MTSTDAIATTGVVAGTGVIAGTDPTAVITVDMGGTTTRAGVCRDGALLPGAVRFATPKPTPGGSIRDEHLDAVAGAVAQLRLAHPEIGDLGVAVGATVDADGLVRNASMLWAEANTGFDLGAALARRLPWARITVTNDIAAAAWRYQALGRFGLITVSTGLAMKIFDDALPFEHKLLLDAEHLGGEIGHVRLDWCVETGAGLPWCECGNVNDLCSYASGPGTARLAATLARRGGEEWRGSKLAVLCDGDPDQISTAALATAAGSGDGFTAQVLRTATRPLALVVLQTSALLGVRRFVVMGGFAHGVGVPWFAALRANLRDLRPEGGWFTGWRDAELDALVEPSRDADDSLLGMARLLAAERGQVREVYKPVGVSQTTVRRVPRPVCGREQFAVRIAFAGICGTDLQMLRGERGCEPGVLGHECVGRVIEVGSDVTGVRVGQVVAVNPNQPDNEHDKIGHNLPGVLREHVVWDGHLAERGQLIRLPGAGRAEWVLLEPLSCAVRSLRLAPRIRRVLVIGAGVSGLLHVLLARHWGAEQVLLANRGPDRLHIAVERGLVPAADCLPANADLPTLVRQASGGAGVDAVIVSVASGAGTSIVERIWPALADGASVHLYGGFLPRDVLHTPDGAAVAVHPIRCGRAHPVQLPDGRNCVLVGSRGASDEDFQTAVDLAAPDRAGIERLDGAAGHAGRPALDLAPLISHVVSLDAAPDVLAELAATGRVAGEPALRVVVDLALSGHVARRVGGEGLPIPAAGLEAVG